MKSVFNIRFLACTAASTGLTPYRYSNQGALSCSPNRLEEENNPLRNLYLHIIEIQHQQSLMRVSIGRILPFNENRKSPGVPIVLEERKFMLDSVKVGEANFVGYPIYYQFVCTLPDPSTEYQYLRVNMRADNSENKLNVGKKQIEFRDIKRNEPRREFLFEYTPPLKGSYQIVMEYAFKVRHFITTSQPPEEKKDIMRATATCDDAFQITQQIVSQSKSLSISFPLLLQYKIICKVPDTKTAAHIEFLSDHFGFKALHESTDILLWPGQAYYAMYLIELKNIAILNEKRVVLGSFRLQYNKGYTIEQKTQLKPNNKMILFRGETIDKHVVKKDIVEVRLKFTRIINVGIKLGNVRLEIEEKDVPAGIKIIKMSKNFINLNEEVDEEVKLSLICLRSGFFQLTGVNLCIRDDKGSEQREVNFINNLTLMVEHEIQQKTETAMERTEIIQLDLTDSLI